MMFELTSFSPNFTSFVVVAQRKIHLEIINFKSFLRKKHRSKTHRGKVFYCHLSSFCFMWQKMEVSHVFSIFGSSIPKTLRILE